MDKKYKLLIFDLDGTLADTSEGIYNSHRYTLSEMGISMTDDLLDGVIGGELLHIYQSRFGLDSEGARKAVDIYRGWYKKVGITQAALYEDMAMTLKCLKDAGYQLAVATLKREDFAKQMLSNLEVQELFDFIFGMDVADTLNKEKLLNKCIEAAEVHAEQSLLIGDSMNDAKGAQAAGVDFLGVTYGFGFRTKENIYAAGAVQGIDQVNELGQYLL